MKIDKQFQGHLKYNPLTNDEEEQSEKYLSKLLKIPNFLGKKGNNYSVYTSLLSKDKQKQGDDDQPKEGIKILSADNYFSAPASTKENGLVNKFKFKDRKNNTGELQITDEEKQGIEEEKMNPDLQESSNNSSSNLDRKSKRKIQESHVEPEVSYH